MKITHKTRLERDAKHLANRQNWGKLNGSNPLTDEERELTVASFELIAAIAEFAASAIGSAQPYVRCSGYDEEGEYQEWISFPDRAKYSYLLAKDGKGRVRLSHAGMALAHELFEIVTLTGARFPPVEELGYKRR